jgi:hypothetical protein
MIGVVSVYIVVGPARGQAVLGDVVHFQTISFV